MQHLMFSPINHDAINLHMAAFYVCCAIGALVFGVLIYSLIRHRKATSAVAAHFHEHLGIDILWTTIPFLILVALAAPATIGFCFKQHYPDISKEIKEITLTCTLDDANTFIKNQKHFTKGGIDL